MLLANINVELVGNIPGMFLIPCNTTPCFVCTSPNGVIAQFPPWSIEISTIVEPGFIALTISSVTITGASFP